jgi:segregation and condensation protein A
MPYSVTLPVFHGPLDLLLHLVEREELEITAVSLRQVTDQFLEAVRALEGPQLADIADFLVVAARLIYIKSQALLPRPPGLGPSDEDAGEDLARQLLAYRKYKEIAGLLHERVALGLRTHLRVAAPPKVEPRLDLSNVRPEDLLLAVRRALSAQPDGPALSSVVVPPKISIRDQISLIGRRLRSGARVSFFDLLAAATSRMEIVVTFLAVLELIKQRRVMAIQERTFGDIEIRRVGEWTEIEDFETEFAE